MTGHGRRYAPHRRAWYPRIWPLVVPAAAFTALLNLWIAPSPLEAAGIGIAVGAIAGQARWWVWRRRHPIITPAQYITDMRRAAPWN